MIGYPEVVFAAGFGGVPNLGDHPCIVGIRESDTFEM